MYQKKIIQTSEAPQAIGPYSQAVRCGNLVFLSGQIPLNPITGAVEGINDFRIQAQQVITNIEAICTAAGGSLANVIKLNIYLTDLDNFSIVNDIMMERFCAPYPARAVVGVRALPKDVIIEAEAILSLA